MSVKIATKHQVRHHVYKPTRHPWGSPPRVYVVALPENYFFGDSPLPPEVHIEKTGFHTERSHPFENYASITKACACRLIDHVNASMPGHHVVQNGNFGYHDQQGSFQIMVLSIWDIETVRRNI